VLGHELKICSLINIFIDNVSNQVKYCGFPKKDDETTDIWASWKNSDQFRIFFKDDEISSNHIKSRSELKVRGSLSKNQFNQKIE
jgi:hypothetical protein